MANTCFAVQVFEQTPDPILRPFIKRFLVVEFPFLHQDTHLPDTGPTAAFSFRGECHIDGGKLVPPVAFTGLWETLRAHEHHQGHAVLLASFTPAGASAFLRPPLEEFTGTTTDLTEILGRSQDFDLLHEQLAEARSHGQRVQSLEDFLIPQIRVAEPDPLVEAAVAWLEKGKGTRRIDDLADYIGLSQSALERRFRRVVGVSPKKFAAVVRLQHALRLRASGMDFATVAQAAGYFDQSHFIHDFRRVTGSAPDAFFRQTATN